MSQPPTTDPTRHHLPRIRAPWALFGACAVIASLAASGLPAQIGARAASGNDVLVPQTSLTQPGTPIGPTDPQRTLQVSVSLRVNDPAALENLIQQLYDPASPSYQQFLTPAEFTSRFIDSGARSRVDAFLQSQGLTVSDDGLGSVVDASGSVAQVEQAFHVQIGDYRAPDGHVYYGNDRTAAYPLTIAGAIQGVFGLDNFPKAVPQFIRPKLTRSAHAPIPATASGCTEALNAIQTWGEGYTPNQFATAYNFTGVGNAGTGQTVALFELDNYLDSNVSSYQSCFGTAVPLQRVLVDESSAPAPGSGEGEVELDIDVIVGLATHITKLLVYESPNTGQGLIDQYKKIANDNLAKVVSSSWDLCERLTGSSQANAEDTIYAQMATQGQGLFDAAGDTGSAGCNRSDNSTPVSVDTTAASPHVTGVGGTTLSLNSNDTIASETAWNDFSSGSGSGGGGVSTFFSRPSYQTGAGTTRYSTTKRQVPDVAADADPNTAYLVFTNDPTNCPFVNGADNCFEPIGGTSAATPLWAAGTATLNEYLQSHSRSILGLANATLYNIFNSASYSSSFHDITVGSNCYIESSPPVTGDCGTPGSSTGLYQTSAGYDPVTGVGTPNFGGIANALLATTTTVASSLNPSTAGQSVTFTAHVTNVAGTPTGTVSFRDNGTQIGTGTLSSGTATFSTSSLAAGTHPITAVYLGATGFTTSSSNTVSQVVNGGTGNATTTTLSAAPTSAAVAQAVTLSAHVTSSAGTPTGTVTFKDGATALGTVTLSSGAASFATSFTAPGTHSLTAVYNPTGSFLTSTSSALSFVVYGPIVVHGNRIAPVRGTAFSLVIGSITDARPGLAAANYRATIDWGDGTAVTAGVVAGSGGTYTITGSHTYATTLAAGTYPIDVTIGVTDGRSAYLASIAQAS